MTDDPRNILSIYTLDYKVYIYNYYYYMLINIIITSTAHDFLNLVYPYIK